MNDNEDIIEDVTETFEQPKDKGMDPQRKIMLGLVVALLLVAAVMYGWRLASISGLEDRLAEAEARQAQARAELIAQATRIDAGKTEESLRRFSIPVAWVIRREAMAGNLDQIDQYFTDLVQMPGMQAAVLAKPDGKILVASDRKKLAEPFANLYPAEYLQASEIRVERAANGSLRAIIPILGLNQHLGTLVLEYLAPAYSLR